MTALCICTQFVSGVAIDRRVWAEAVVFECMENSIVRNYKSKQKSDGTGR